MPIVQYVRRGKKLVGVLFADKSQEGQIVISASRCRSIDTFKKAEGLRLATERVKNAIGEGRKIVIPFTFENDYNEFAKRAIRYFKTENIKKVKFSEP